MKEDKTIVQCYKNYQKDGTVMNSQEGEKVFGEVCSTKKIWDEGRYQEGTGMIHMSWDALHD